MKIGKIYMAKAIGTDRNTDTTYRHLGHTFSILRVSSTTAILYVSIDLIKM